MPSPTSRRRFLAGGAAGAAGAPAALNTDVVIVGGGLAGLTAARRLTHHGVRVVVLEARGRVGGRTLNHPIGHGHVAEAGGEFVGPTQDRVLALAKELGIGIFNAYDKGDNVYLYPPYPRTLYSDTTPLLGTA